MISGHPAERGTFEIMLAVMERPHLADDPRFETVASRLEHFELLRAEMTQWARTVPDAETFENRCAQHGLAMGVVRSVRELAATEWAHARGAITRIPDRIGGYIRVPNSPWHFRDAQVGMHGEPRYRGEDNRAVLRDMAGLSDAEIDELERAGVLSSRLPRG